MKKIIVFLIALSLFFSGLVMAMEDPISSGSASSTSGGMVVGADSDEHGCKGSAGYSWCEEKQKCLRIWEESCLSSSTSVSPVAVAITPVAVSSVSSLTSEKAINTLCAGQNYDEIKTKCIETNGHLIKKVSSSGCIEMVCAETTAEAVEAESCIDENLNKQLNQVFINLKEAENNNDTEGISIANEKIGTLSSQIKALNEKCQLLKPTETVPVFASSTSGGASPAVVKIYACNDAEAYIRKINYLQNILNNSDTINKTGLTFDQISQKIIEINITLSERQKNCSNITKANLGVLVSEAVKSKTGGANDIVAYYKMKISDVVSSDQGIYEKIESLKQLRKEIDKMIEEMMKKQKNISSEELMPIVSEITVRPSEIIVDDLEINSTENSISIILNNTLAEINVNETDVSLDSGNVKAMAIEIRFENNTIKVGNSTVRVPPSEIVANMSLIPKKIYLMEENNRAIYKVSADEDRKLFGIIAMKVEKQLSFDGYSGNVVSESAPFWFFLTTAIK